MLKLLHPQLCPGQVPRTLLEQMVAFAVEMRKRVIDQMAVMKPGDFQDGTIGADDRGRFTQAPGADQLAEITAFAEGQRDVVVSSP